MANISTQKSTFTNLKVNNVKQEYTTHKITAASQGKIETVDFDLYTAEKDDDIDFENWWKNKAAPFIEDVSSKTGEVLERTGATLATGTVSLIEGLGQFGEAAVDLFALTRTISASVGTGLYDGYQALNGLITGKEWESVTKKMWGNTKEFVATEHVKTWFDKLYDNTNVGQWMKEEAYGFDTVRAVGSGVGYIAGVIGISLLTFGTGGIAIGGTSAATGTVTATQLAGTATAAGFSRGTERAWANGADIGEGLGYGALSGIWEGLQFYVGAKISAPGGFGDQIAAKFANNSLLAGSLARISLDGATGGAEGFMQPLLDLVYKDSYTNANGKEVKFDEDMTFKEKYKEAFDDAGGWQNVGIQTIIGTGMSSFGEFGNLRNILAPEGNNKIQIEKISDEVLDVPSTEVKMKYTDFTLEQIENNDYKKISDMFFTLVKDDKTKEKLEKILYEGGYEEFGLSSHISNRDNPRIEMQRRISMANLLVQNPKTFDKLVEKNINIFHGTNANSLPSILKEGINSYDESINKGIDVTTGESWSRNSGRSFISFTDVLDVAEGYSTLGSTKGNENLSFEVVIGTTKEEIKKTRQVTIHSDVPEIGVMNNFPKESIKVLCVPPSKVKYVKKITNNNEIEVLGVQGISDKFYYVDEMGSFYIDENKYEQIKNNIQPKERTFKLSELKDLVYNKIF